MKRMKKWLSLFPLLLAALSVNLLTGADSYLVSDGFYFWMNGDESAVIHGCDSEKTELAFPVLIGNAFITGIDDFAFYKNKGLTALDFAPQIHLQTIGDSAFYGCSNLSGSLLLPLSLHTLENAAFEGCSALTSVTVQENVSKISAQCFYRCTALSTVTLRNGLQSIDDFAFANCPALKYLEIPSTVTSISPSAFLNDSIVLGVYYDSYAYRYAVNQDIPFVLLDSVIAGDANLSGFINITDVTAIQRHLADLEVLNALQCKAADFNRDGKVSVEDATLIQRYLAEYDDIV